MSNSISSTTPVSQQYLQHQQQAKPPAKPQQQEPQDKVVLSKHAQGASDPDHDGD
jgi:hypothetical protein